MNAKKKRLPGSALGQKSLRSHVKDRSGSPASQPVPRAASKEKEKPVPAESRTDKKEALPEFPVVGVGASAGGLEAFTQFLQHLPVNSGMAFVLVQHLDPEHPSALTQLLARTTAMQVSEVVDGMMVAPNHVYVIPPNTSMIIADGVLRLQPRAGEGVHRSIDLFFESLAEDQGEKAIGIILSGAATDGTLGLETIKSKGGITFAQDDSAKYDSMPRSAVAAGCVDFVLSPKMIAKELARIARHSLVKAQATHAASACSSRLSSSVGRSRREQSTAEPVFPDPVEETAFRKILLLLRNHSGVDFSFYKAKTIERRIARRMVLNHHHTLSEYARFLKRNAKEIDLLYADMLIGVTSFFRNPEAFEVLKRKVFPALLDQKHRQGEPVRVWIVGCSSGQEAYSIAMTFIEACDKIARPPKLQIFATDLNEATLERARRGLYARSMVADISPQRLRRFFVEEQGSYRISKSLRDVCVFARQNILSDPPFSRMDLVSCRNTMIYLGLELQKRILPNFHYALKPGGFLFLGTSESIGAFTHLFDAVDKKNKIYSRKTAPQSFHLPVEKAREESRSPGPPRLARHSVSMGIGPAAASADFRGELNVQRMADQIAMNRFAPPGVLIDFDLQILQFRGTTHPYLEQSSGRPSFDVLKMAREGLMLPLRAAINKAKKTNKVTRIANALCQWEGDALRVNIEVIPLKKLTERYFLIFFEDAEKKVSVTSRANSISETPTQRRGGKSSEPQSAQLQRELTETRGYLQSIREQHESAIEELQASHEEVQSANEELQSTNEELETSKEELESTNEELTTVNEEMANRNADLSRLNSDLINLQTSTRLPIVLLGRDLTIRRFSPQAEKQFNLLATDLGRMMTSVHHNLDLPDLEALITDVILTVREREREVCDKDGRWFSLRVSPYLTLDNKVDGATLVLVDIDELKKTQMLITEARAHAESIIRTVPDPLVILNADLSVHSANEAFYRTFKLTTAETIGRLIFELGHGSWNIPALNKLLGEIIPRNTFFNDFEVAHDFEGTGRRTLLFTARPLDHLEEKSQQILLGIRDITEVLAFQVDLRRSELRYRRLFEAANDGVLLIDAKTRKIIGANPFIAQLLGYTRAELYGKELYEIGMLKDRMASEEAFRQLQATGQIRYDDLPLQTKEAHRREVEFVSTLYEEEGEKVIQCNIRDITERKLAERRFQSLLESAPDPMIITDADGTITLINAQTEKFFGYSRGELIGRPVEVLMPLPLRDGHPRQRQKFYKTPRVRPMGLGLELFGLRKDGTEFPIEISLSPLETETGTVVTAAVRDVTERKKAEEALRRSEERYRTLFNSIDEGFCVIEMLFDANAKPVDFIFLEVNPSFEKHAKIPHAPGKRMTEILPDLEPFWLAMYGNVALTGIPIRFENEANALKSWFDVYAFRLGNLQSRKVAVLFNNITERKANEEALRQAQTQLADRANQLEQAVNQRTAELTNTNKQLESLLYTVAHDLRAPLRAMQGFSDLLVEEAGNVLTEPARDFARRISTAAQSLDAMLRDLITFSGIAEQRIELAPVKLEGVVRTAIDSLKREAQEKGGQIDATGPWPAVIAHKFTLQSVLAQLLANALKFVAPGEPPLVRIKIDQGGEFVRVWVEDNGIGIAPAHQEQIFRLFTRLHGDKFPGTGLGLAIVKKGIERMGGRVGVDSAVNQGSRFWFELKKA